MPIAFNTKKTFWLSLFTDADLPDGERPEFQFRFTTMGEYIAMEEALDEGRNGNEPDRVMMPKLATTLAIPLLGWRNVKDRDGEAIEFKDSKSLEILSTLEFFDLFQQYMKRAHGDELALKKTPGSLSASITDSSVPAADPQAAA